MVQPPAPITATTDLLRFSTAGSVDDGKSTLIGRLMYETKSIFEDQLEAIERASRDQGADYVNLALLTDGLRAEREQGITIDVAYRYFSTPKRTFILADTPGHVQYTRNMVTGASTSDLAVILVDASHGITEQSRRHAFIASLLRIPHFVICVNKMDLVDYSQDVFEAIRRDFQPFLDRLAVPDPRFIPISALYGDNVVDRSASMVWYDGPTLLHCLETVSIAKDRNLVDLRFPVQWVIRPHRTDYHDYRGYAGQVAGGLPRPGDEVVTLPGGFKTRIKSIDTLDGPTEVAFPPMSVTLTLADDLDVSRGDMIVAVDDRPAVGQDLEATVCWLSTSKLSAGKRYAIKHTTRNTRAVVKELRFRVEINSLGEERGVESLGLNEIGRVSLRTAAPLFYDPYHRNRTTGSFILIDEATNETVGAGILLDPLA
ncbi:MAG: sulfate adenylyltransferase subunit 1 [Chloroflexota bacterium]